MMAYFAQKASKSLQMSVDAAVFTLAPPWVFLNLRKYISFTQKHTGSRPTATDVLHANGTVQYKE